MFESCLHTLSDLIVYVGVSLAPPKPSAHFAVQAYSRACHLAQRMPLNVACGSKTARKNLSEEVLVKLPLE